MERKLRQARRSRITAQARDTSGTEIVSRESQERKKNDLPACNPTKRQLSDAGKSLPLFGDMEKKKVGDPGTTREVCRNAKLT